MSRLSRNLKRSAGRFRDRRLFVIVCEGAKTERLYFDALFVDDSRVDIITVPPPAGSEHESSPRFLLERAVRYQERHRLRKEDQLWFVLDRDAWKMDQLVDLMRRCQPHVNKSWFMALSNPCFEIWLYQHFKDLPGETHPCQEWKRQVRRVQPGRPDQPIYARNLDDALRRAEEKDTQPNETLAPVNVTKVYQLIRELLQVSPKTKRSSPL